MLDAYDSRTKALVTFFEATSRGETDRRLRSEVYIAEGLLARPRMLSSCEIGGSLTRHGLMEVRRHCGDQATMNGIAGVRQRLSVGTLRVACGRADFDDPSALCTLSRV